MSGSRWPKVGWTSRPIAQNKDVPSHPVTLLGRRVTRAQTIRGWGGDSLGVGCKPQLTADGPGLLGIYQHHDLERE